MDVRPWRVIFSIFRGKAAPADAMLCPAARSTDSDNQGSFVRRQEKRAIARVEVDVLPRAVWQRNPGC